MLTGGCLREHLCDNGKKLQSVKSRIPAIKEGRVILHYFHK